MLRFADICIKGFVPKCTAMLPKEAVVGSELSISQTGDLSGLITTSCIPPRQIAGSMQKPDDDDANKEEISLEESPLPPQTPLTTCPIVQPVKPIYTMPLKRKAPSSEDANTNKKKKQCAPIPGAPPTPITEASGPASSTAPRSKCAASRDATTTRSAGEFAASTAPTFRYASTMGAQ